MVNIVVVTHGGFADGIMSTFKMLAGDSGLVTTLSLEEGMSPDTFTQDLKEKLGELNSQPDCEGSLVLVDVFGGTPSKCVASIMNEVGADKVRCLAGLNFPMLVEAVFERNNKSLVELEKSCKEAAVEGVMSIAEVLQM